MNIIVKKLMFYNKFISFNLDIKFGVKGVNNLYWLCMENIWFFYDCC